MLTELKNYSGCKYIKKQKFESIERKKIYTKNIWKEERKINICEDMRP